MAEFDAATPVIMSFSSFDPSGSSGIQADIECAASLGCHCTPIISTLCAKDTNDTKEIIPVDAGLLIEQARAILEDMQIKAIKIGFLGSVENVEAVHSILRDYPSIPVVLDPVTSVCNSELMDAPNVVRATENLLLPMALVATPDLVEAHELAQQGDTIEACAQEILETGCEYLLISGAKRTHDSYENHLYSKQGLVRSYPWERLKVFSHGCGATLAASITCYLGHGLRTEEAVEQGQKFTWQCLAHSRRLGMGKRIPNRFFWTDQNKR
ncbi:hydroxymethylpyrimidine/phosphomethylpyrimidine kinase [Pseudomaricurvus alkylphenolicus]|jgi:hydroxymethylpyrimidine/phosphomethylpyrimidine kinase|uniref:bifunctional hydroxymethylpyrimidine kinase/phosphomethylpyrimidine kinase n=1 Tax=Pseudomaricurvus alkylphenolicus TaxID=1306991 RepID=UPI0014209E1C|nr:hydroxymethylpyrimidine/phosphomethylpyrimidine kinase [Pseudomaricurvus alkylphenolicus]NIB39030.1 hydroxymethylpyrimidine/phosphomethylpyrimidine kinase [Pseudomaricurvus alkylphenolicus]